MMTFKNAQDDELILTGQGRFCCGDRLATVMATTLVLDREGRIRAASRNPLTLIGRDICASHILEVWDLIPKYVTEAIVQGFGLRIPGLVSFNCKTITYSNYLQQFTMDKRVHMLISEDIVKNFGLNAGRPIYTLGPAFNLNYSKITRDLKMPRFAVDACINEVIHAFKRAIETYRRVKFVFEGIGILTVSDNKVTYCFDPYFLHINGFGKRIIYFKSKFPCVCPPRRITQRCFHECVENEAENEDDDPSQTRG